MLFLLACSPPARAAFILQTATLGQTGFTSSNGPSGFFLTGTGYFAARFHVGQTTVVDLVGGHLVRLNPSGDPTIFAAITALPSSTALPADPPTTFTPLAFTVMSLPDTSQDVFAPLPVTLPIGDYALVLGSGRFGATGSGYLVNNNTPIGSPSFFYSDPGVWIDGSGSFGNVRLAVTALDVVPEPGSLVLTGTGAVLALLGTVCGRRRKLPGNAANAKPPSDG
jgi:hypothetical protein